MTRFLGALIGTLRPCMHKALLQRDGISYCVSVQLKYSNPVKEIKDMDPPYLHSGTQRLLIADDIKQHLDRIRELIIIRHANYIRQSSGLVVDEILNFRFKMANFHPLRGRAYRELPDFLAKKHAIVKVQNQDNRCFGYAILACITRYGHGEHASRPQHYNHLFHKRRLNQISYPVAIQEMSTVEDTILINVNAFSF